MPYEYFMDTIQDSHFIQSKTDRLCQDMGKTDHIGVFDMGNNSRTCH